MEEIILNIYLIINKGLVEGFRAVAYTREGGDDNKIKFLKSRVKEDFESAYRFDSPVDEKGNFMSYKRFHKFMPLHLSESKIKEVWNIVRK